MNDFRLKLQQFTARAAMSAQRFMAGRYGMDKLNYTLLWTSVIISLANLFLPMAIVRLVLTGVSYLLLIWVLFRALSRKTYRRYRENRRFLMLVERWRDRDHRYYSCPRCRQPVRVPRHKGKISICCPRCQEKFTKKT